MGCYCGYKLGNWEIDSSKSYIYPELAESFHEMGLSLIWTLTTFQHGAKAAQLM